MQILLCAATSFEIQPTLDLLGRHHRAGVEVLITGVGLAAATYHISKALQARRPHLVLQAGVAGSLDASFVPGDVVAVKDEVIGDAGVVEEAGFRSLFDLNLEDPEVHPWQGGKLVNPFSIFTPGLPLVSAVTVNEISTSADRIRYYREALKAQVESLEGAALHYVALSENINFLQLRAISNFIGERDKSRWKLAEAIDRLNQELIQQLSKLLDV